MDYKSFFTSNFLVKGIFVASLVILIFISGISYKNSITVSESSDLVLHTYKVQVQLEQLVSNLIDAESYQKGYIITRDSSFLMPYKNSNLKVKASLKKLKLLTAANAHQQSNLISLALLIETRFLLLEKTIANVSQNKLTKDELIKNMLLSKKQMDIIRSNASRMINLDNLNLKEQQKKYEHEISFTPLITLLLLFFSLLVFIFSFYKINKDIEVLKKSNLELLITTESFKHAEEIGDFSSWRWDLDSNEFTYSDSQYHLLCCEPQSFRPGINEFLQFVHPTDTHLLVAAGEALIHQGHYPTTLYRIIRKDGKLRYFKSLGKMLTDVSGKRIFIGINSDITEEYLNSIALEERNRELEQSNKELASFNHIASHDMQEPLRKIQTFISRIADNESFGFSGKAKEYFTRIQLSAERMRLLIDDLLLFSRTNRIEKVFENSDLNALLENAKQELIQSIEEKNALIHAEKLPVLSVIPFQIQQLFMNLLGNSLKYSKPGIAPQITVKYLLEQQLVIPHVNIDPHLKFHKLTFIDNGIGFDAQYAESIFILFSRLHTVADYPGTGIGLSICKKIIENHKGYILAEGKELEGATFHIFLPA